PGEMSKTITVSVVGDTVDEPNESFVVNLSGAVNAGVADAQGAGTIVDDDTAALSITDAAASEGGTATFTVSLSTTSSQTVTVDFATADGTAAAGSDFDAVSGTLTFAPGETSKTISVNTLTDTIDELEEAFVVNLSNAVNAGIADGQGVGTIVDDDSTALSIRDATVPAGNSGTGNAVSTVPLSGASSQAVTVNSPPAAGPVVAGSDFAALSGGLTFAPGETSKTISVAVAGDTVDELDETFVVNLSGASVAVVDGQGAGTIVDDDTATLSINDVSVTEGNSGSVNAGFTVTLSTASSQ